MERLGVIISCFCVGAMISVLVWAMLGSGGWKRKVTISGIYTVCKPDGYDVVCFADSDSPDGGLFCMPLAGLGGRCR